MKKELHSGFISSAVQKYFSDQSNFSYWKNILRDLSTFTLEIDNLKTDKDDSLFVVIDNLLSRGLPTIPTILIEDALEKSLQKTKKRIPDKTGNIFYDISTDNNHFLEFLKRAFVIIEPRLKRSDNLLFPMRSWENHSENEFEKRFQFESLPKYCSDYICQLLEPQRCLKTILQFSDQEKRNFNNGNDKKEFYNQKVDFAIQFPKFTDYNSGLVIEIDGSQHNDISQKQLDEKRDNACEKKGWHPTVRIKTNEIGTIPEKKLDEIKTFLSHPYAKEAKINYEDPLWKSEDGLDALQLALTPFAIARIEKTLVQTISSKKLNLNVGKWQIAVIERDVPCARLAIDDFRLLTANLFELEGKNRSLLPEIELKIFNTPEFSKCSLNRENSTKFYSDNVDPFNADLLIDISMLQRYGYTKPSNEFLKCVTPKNLAIIRSSYSTVKPRLIISSHPIEYKVDKSEEPAPLVYFLQNIFRKETFRKHQVDILRRALMLEDVIASLPTGLGKSLCYQLSALLQPGIVIIIDPLRSLMRDQDDNLKDMGIDSTTIIDSSLKNEKERQDREKKMKEGYYQFIFVSPERLLIKEFREYLEDMKNVLFSYCVVDEAHCVSEWGHDFRTSYLRLGQNVRKYCKSALDKMPIIALTGTASYDVLSDVQRILEIKDEQAQIIPSSYQREELHFEIVPVSKPETLEEASAFEIKKAVAKQKQIQLLQELRNLPQKFGESKNSNEDFFKLNGDKTNSGIVFCPYKGKKSDFGVETISFLIKSKIPQFKETTDFYAGSSGEEDRDVVDLHRQKVQDNFKRNKLALLVATKAFGMGIDKPNIRYSIHFNMPQSIESYYQEAGRCGRDKQTSYCMILYSDMLIPQKEEKEEKNLPVNITVDKSLMLAFHHNAFKGINKEKRILFGLLSQITYLNSNPKDGIEAILKRIKIGEEKPITIGFENDKITQINQYLKENTNRNYSPKMINKANEWCYDINQFIKNLKIKRWTTGKNHKENIKPLFEQIRDERDTFKAIYRLSIIGVISDYEVDYNTKTITATVKKYNNDEYVSHLQSYIKEYVSKKEAERVPEDILKETESSVIRKCLSYLIKFVYKKIAAKRREAINAMEFAIKTEMREKGSFERYVNTYFDSRFIPELSKYRKEYSLDLVWKYMELTEGEPDAAKHLHGACTHLLVENSDNGAFRLMRAFAGYSIDTYDKNQARDDFTEGWRLFRENEDLRLEWKEYVLGASKFYLITTEYNPDTAPYLQERILNIHLEWLKGFNVDFLKGGESNV